MIHAMFMAIITIVINGDKLPLQPPPVFEKNFLVVPVRRTLEALGLPFDRSGNHITTQVGSKSVMLSVGNRIASVNGERVALDAPMVEINSVLYAPLRFFTDVLGAQASYDKKTNSVNIVAQLVGRTSNGLSSTGGGYSRSGTVAAVDVLSDPPTLTLGYMSGPRTIPIARNAIIEMEDVNANVLTPGELGDVRPGDYARVEMRKDGHVEHVIDAFGSRSGTIVAVAPGQFVLSDGQVIGSGRSTEVALNGKAASFGDLQAGDQVSVRYNVETNEVREVLAARAAVAVAPSGAGTHITSVDADATHALRAGDVLRVTVRGTAGGAATFDIGSYVTNLAMSENPAGTYSGQYAIPRGSNFAAVPIIAHLAAGGGQAVDAAAPQLLSAASTPPGISDFAPESGATVNNSRPAIYAAFTSDAVPVNPSSAQLWVDGRDVTSECVRTAQFIQYLPSYSYRDGPVRVEVRVADRAGNVTSKSWTFTIRTH